MRTFHYIFCRVSRLGMAVLQLAAVVSGWMSDGVGRSAGEKCQASAGDSALAGSG